MENKGGKTTRFTSTRSELTPREVLTTVYAAMKEKGYDPVKPATRTPAISSCG